MHRYPFLRFAAGVLRVLGWVALVLGVIGSIGSGVIVGMTAEGMVEGIAELPFVSVLAGAMVIIAGMIASFLVWLFLLSTRELFLLAIDVEQNTRDTAEREPGQSI